MSDPYLGEIRIFPFDYAPQGWAQCNGQVLPISVNQALFSLLGKTYGGNGQTTFALPNLMERVPVHVGNTAALGQAGGEETHTLTVQELPTHIHAVMASTDTANMASPSGNVWANQQGLYSNQANAAMYAGAVLTAGKNYPHSNMQPYAVVNICIALVGEFPPHS